MRGSSVPSANRYETRLGQVAGLGERYACASLETRTAWGAASPHAGALVRVGAGVAAPLLIEYVRWLLGWVQTMDLDRVYFLARDGQLLLRLAEALAPFLGINAQLRYLHVSRVTLNLAAAGRVDKSTIPWVLTGVRRLSRGELGARLNLYEKEVAELLAGTELEEWGEEPLGKRRVDALEAVLLQPHLDELLRMRATERRDATTRYLVEQGFFDSGDVAVVDLGGSGSQLLALAALRHSSGRSVPDAFLVYRERSQLSSSPRFRELGLTERIHTLVHDAVNRRGPALVSGFVPMLEAFCAADHGRVEGYQFSAGGMEPVVAEDAASAVASWGLPQVRGAIDGVVHRVAPDVGCPTSDQLLAAVLANMEEFVRSPTVAEAKAWGSFPLSAGSHSGCSELARPTTWTDALAFLLKSPARRASSRWWPGSNARASLPIRTALGAARLTRRQSLRPGA